MCRSRSLDGPKERPAVCVASPNTPVILVLKKLAAAHLHRVYVVNTFRCPVGVVSLKDILRCL